MYFEETILKGVYLIGIQKLEDERGFFARSWCAKEFESRGLNSRLVQCNISYNRKKGTLRGMHYQIAPHAEAKLVRCSSGSIYDVIIDLRSESFTYKKWLAVELSSKNYKMIYIPEGFAHGFQTLEDETEVLYKMTEFFHPESACGIRWNDPNFNIEWPIQNKIISSKDEQYSDFNL